jgi:cytochrome c556
MGGIGDILKEGLPYKANIAQHAAAINATAKNMVAAFEKNVAAGATDAKADIWKDWNDFKDGVSALEQASAKLMQVAASGNMAMTGDAVKALGAACGDCHKPFRKPKEESYKNR